jgi:hypothetical protein
MGCGKATQAGLSGMALQGAAAVFLANMKRIAVLEGRMGGR